MNLTRLKKALVKGVCFEIVDHWKAECIGQIREVNSIQTNGFYSIIHDNPNAKESKANNNKGSWMPFRKASHWTFENGLCKNYSNSKKDELVICFKIKE